MYVMFAGMWNALIIPHQAWGLPIVGRLHCLLVPHLVTSSCLHKVVIGWLNSTCWWRKAGYRWHCCLSTQWDRSDTLWQCPPWLPLGRHLDQLLPLILLCSYCTNPLWFGPIMAGILGLMKTCHHGNVDVVERCTPGQGSMAANMLRITITSSSLLLI